MKEWWISKHKSKWSRMRQWFNDRNKWTENLEELNDKNQIEDEVIGEQKGIIRFNHSSEILLLKWNFEK